MNFKKQLSVSCGLLFVVVFLTVFAMLICPAKALGQVTITITTVGGYQTPAPVTVEKYPSGVTVTTTTMPAGWYEARVPLKNCQTMTQTVAVAPFYVEPAPIVPVYVDPVYVSMPGYAPYYYIPNIYTESYFVGETWWLYTGRRDHYNHYIYERAPRNYHSGYFPPVRHLPQPVAGRPVPQYHPYYSNGNKSGQQLHQNYRPQASQSQPNQNYRQPPQTRQQQQPLQPRQSQQRQSSNRNDGGRNGGHRR